MALPRRLMTYSCEPSWSNGELSGITIEGVDDRGYRTFFFNINDPIPFVEGVRKTLASKESADFPKVQGHTWGDDNPDTEPKPHVLGFEVCAVHPSRFQYELGWLEPDPTLKVIAWFSEGIEGSFQVETPYDHSFEEMLKEISELPLAAPRT